VPAIRPPTVPEGSARLRIALSAAHSEADVDKLVSTLQQIAALPR
jgi:8-amino-7-oxononanoate synthase